MASPGRPLDGAARAGMESHFGRDLGRVRVHDDGPAAASAAAVAARAYAAGQHVVFGRGEYRPDDPAGRHLLAHELAHTVQQGPADGAAGTPRVVAPPGGAAEREAEAAARSVTGSGSPPALTPAGPQVARQPVPAADDSEARAALTGEDPIGPNSPEAWEAAVQEVEDLKEELAADNLRADEASTLSRKEFEEERARRTLPNPFKEQERRAARNRAKVITGGMLLANAVLHKGDQLRRAITGGDEAIPRPDWAGKEILARWLAGEGDWDIRDDRRWEEYMMGSEPLRARVFAELLQEVSPNVAGNAGEAVHPFARRFQASTGVQSALPSGYGYLHGTDRNAGGFEMGGKYSVRPAGDGGWVVAARLNFTWNDKINRLEGVDDFATAVGEAITFGDAASYTIRIHWDSMTLLRFDAQGRAVEDYGYPGQTKTDWGKDFPEFDWPPE